MSGKTSRKPPECSVSHQTKDWTEDSPNTKQQVCQIDRPVQLKRQVTGDRTRYGCWQTRVAYSSQAVLALPATPVWSIAHLYDCHSCLSKLCSFIIRLVNSSVQHYDTPASSASESDIQPPPANLTTVWAVFSPAEVSWQMARAFCCTTFRHWVNFDVPFSHGVQKHMFISACRSFRFTRREGREAEILSPASAEI
jgi:hypothetical protein